MPSRPLRTPASLGDQAFWLGATILVLGQLVAFWMLCTQQVHKAEIRNAAMQVERVALMECLRSVPGASLNTCTERLHPQERDGQAVAGAAAPAGEAVPVNYVYR